MEKDACNLENTLKIIKKNPKRIIGLKFRYSSQSIGKSQEYIKILNALKKYNIQTMYHVGNEPPKFKDLLPFLKKKDIITHYANGKNNE